MSVLKKLEFIDGVDVTAPADLTAESSTTHLAEYVDDAAFVSANGTATGGDCYINTTLRAIRVYTGSAWRTVAMYSNAADATKTWEVNLSGATTGTKATLVFSNTANRSYTFQDETGAIPVLPILLNSEVGGTLSIANGGTGQTTAQAAIDALLPDQTAALGKFLSSDGTNASWEDVAGGSGSGSGEINAVLNPNDANAGWAAGTSHSVSNLASGSPLNPVIPTGIRVSATSTASESSTSGGAYSISTMPAGLYNRKLKVEFYFTTAASQTWAVSVYASSTRKPLSTDSSSVTTLPAGVTGGKFVAYFDTDSSTAYSVRLTRTAGSGTTNLDVTNVIVGPGIQPQGAVKGPRVSWGTPSTANLGTVTNAALFYQRDGEDMIINGTLKVGTPAGAVAALVLPGSFTINAAAHTDGRNVLGYIQQNAASAGALSSGLVAVLYDSADATSLYFSAQTDTVASNNTASPENGSAVFNTNATLSFVNVRVAISQWAGSGTVNLAQNDVQYHSNSGMGDADDTSNFVHGPAGSPIPTVNYSSTRKKRIQLLTPLQIGECLVFKVDLNGTGKFILPETLTYGTDGDTLTQQQFEQQSTFIFGMGKITEVSGNPLQYDVHFAPYRCRNSSSYAAAGANWTTSSARWRVEKSVSGQAVGFGLASTTSSGLVNPYVEGSGVVYSAEYTPTCTAVSNIGSVANGRAWYQRVGKMVTVYGSFSGTPSSGGGTATVASVTLPIATNLTNVNQLKGVCNFEGGKNGGYVTGDTSSDYALVAFNATTTGNDNVDYTFSYMIQ